MDLIEDHQLVFVDRKKCAGIGEPRVVILVFKIQVGRSGLPANLNQSSWELRTLTKRRVSE